MFRRIRYRHAYLTNKDNLIHHSLPVKIPYKAHNIFANLGTLQYFYLTEIVFLTADRMIWYVLLLLVTVV